MPRCVDVICRNEVVEMAKAGKIDVVFFILGYLQAKLIRAEIGQSVLFYFCTPR